MTAVDVSGMRIMSDSWMPLHPAIDEPSNILPSSKKASLTTCAGTLTCCSFPRVSVRRRSTNFTPFSSIIFKTSAGDMILLHYYWFGRASHTTAGKRPQARSSGPNAGTEPALMHESYQSARSTFRLAFANSGTLLERPRRPTLERNARHDAPNRCKNGSRPRLFRRQPGLSSLWSFPLRCRPP